MPRNFYCLGVARLLLLQEKRLWGRDPRRVRGVGESIKQTLVLGLDAREQGVSWSLIMPLHMASLLPHDLCHGQSSSRWPPANSISLSILRCGASVLWLTLFHMPNLLSFLFFVLLCFSFWLCFSGWLFLTMNYHAPLNSCPISCPWINWTSVLMGLKLSTYLVIFQPIIMKFCSLFSFFHFLWDSIYIYFSILKIVSNLSDAQLIFPTVFSFLFSMSLFNILNILQLHE